jgi:hypothetical protein
MIKEIPICDICGKDMGRDQFIIASFDDRYPIPEHHPAFGGRSRADICKECYNRTLDLWVDIKKESQRRSEN